MVVVWYLKCLRVKFCYVICELWDLWENEYVKFVFLRVKCEEW